MKTLNDSHFKLLCWCLCTLASAAAVLAAPPKVVKAAPDNNATNVDPDLREIRIEFDQPMSHGGRTALPSAGHSPLAAG